MSCRAKYRRQRGWNGNDRDEMPILVTNERTDRQPVPLLKRTNGTTETVRRQSTVGTVGEGSARNTLCFGLLKTELSVHLGLSLKFVRERCSSIRKDPPLDILFIFPLISLSLFLGFSICPHFSLPSAS